MHFSGPKYFALDSAIVKTKKQVKLAWKFPNLFNISLQRSYQIKIHVVYYDKIKKMVHYPKIDRAKENLKLSHSGPYQRQASETNSHVFLSKHPELSFEYRLMTSLYGLGTSTTFTYSFLIFGNFASIATFRIRCIYISIFCRQRRLTKVSKRRLR